jgi:predicted MPP superfamily phosphohydrolase
MKNQRKRILEIEPKGKAVFVGDTHGDLNASTYVIEKYLKPDNKIIFLGDYVDRGWDSKGNIDFLLRQKEKNPEQVYLLLGNHEGWGAVQCYPCNFWESANEKEKAYYKKRFADLPLAVSIGNIIALHGALPCVKELKEINDIMDGDNNWMSIVWGKFYDVKGGLIGGDYRNEAPQFGRDYFNEAMRKLGKKVLIRAHQHNSFPAMYNDRCLTLYTSSCYPRERLIAVADLEKEINSAEDLIIESI